MVRKGERRSTADLYIRRCYGRRVSGGHSDVNFSWSLLSRRVSAKAPARVN